VTEPTAGWHPSAEIMEQAQVTRLARALDCESYEALVALSLQDPRRYWDAVNAFCGICWRQPYRDYVDLSRGPEFPEFFPGGRLNWTDTILGHADTTPDRPAVTAVMEAGAEDRLSYGELRDRVRRFAGGLRGLGLGRGDRIGLLMENGTAATVSFLAISYIGAIAVPLFSGFGSDAIYARLVSCEAAALIVSGGFARRGKLVSTSDTVLAVVAALAGGEGPGLRVIQRVAPGGDDRLWPGAVDWEGLATSPAMPEAEEMASADPFMLIYTSGTTGKPKGTVHTHGGFPVKIAHDAAVHFDVSREAVYCWPADMGWIAGALVLTAALSHGAHLICYDGAPNHPDWGRLGRLIERHRITHFGSAPTLIRGLAANMPESTSADMSSVRLLITAGESISPEHFTWFQDHVGPGNTPVINYTGGSEASGALLSSVVVRPIPPGTFNTVSPGVAADVVDAAGRSITGEVGELVVRAPFLGMTQGFWRDAARYLETYWQTIPGLWVHGDLAIRDRDGNFLLVGRSDDTIKVAGKRVGPAEIEGILAEIDGIREVAVIGVEDPVKGQSIAVFVTAPGADLATLTREIRARTGDRLGKPFIPKASYLVDDLPKTRSSKIMRRVIRAVYSGGPVGDLSSLVNPEAIEAIRQAIAAQDETQGA
jgi:acetyl-CoA synthetase